MFGLWLLLCWVTVLHMNVSKKGSALEDGWGIFAQQVILWIMRGRYCCFLHHTPPNFACWLSVGFYYSFSLFEVTLGGRRAGRPRMYRGRCSIQGGLSRATSGRGSGCHLVVGKRVNIFTWNCSMCNLFIVFHVLLRLPVITSVNIQNKHPCGIPGWGHDQTLSDHP